MVLWSGVGVFKISVCWEKRNHNEWEERHVKNRIIVDVQTSVERKEGGGIPFGLVKEGGVNTAWESFWENTGKGSDEMKMRVNRFKPVRRAKTPRTMPGRYGIPLWSINEQNRMSKIEQQN